MLGFGVKLSIDSRAVVTVSTHVGHKGGKLPFLRDQ